MPSLGQIMAGAIAGAVGSAANAIKNSNKNKGSSSSNKGSSGGSTSRKDRDQAVNFGNSSGNKGSSSGGSSGGSSGSSSGGSYKYGNYNNDSGTQTITSSDAAKWQAGADQAAKNWHNATTAEEKQYWHDQAIKYNTQLGKSYDDSTGKWSGGYAIVDPNPYEGAMDQYRDYMQQASDAQQDAIQAGVDSAVADLNAQRNQVGKLTKQNNAAAERAYMQTINPNGSLAENLAANGLLSSGITETSQIQAGNTYQGALNQNAQTQTEAIAEIERAITQAQLNGDLTAAQALSDLLTQIAQQGYQNVSDIAQWDQWNKQFGYNQDVTDAGLTGVYNGSPTLEAQRLELERQQLEQQQQEIDQQLELGRITIEQYNLQNQQLQQEIQYNAWQMKQLGVS